MLAAALEGEQHNHEKRNWAWPSRHRRCRTAGHDLGERRSACLVATPSENRLSIRRNSLAFTVVSASQTGISLREISAELAQCGIMNERGQPFSAASINSMLVRECALGRSFLR
jgi:hypothetical protein